jgi:hypothetical protein
MYTNWLLPIVAGSELVSWLVVTRIVPYKCTSKIYAISKIDMEAKYMHPSYIRVTRVFVYAASVAAAGGASANAPCNAREVRVPMLR